MNNQIIKYIVLFLLCVIFQAIIFNKIILFHVAVPFIFIYFIVRLPISFKLSYLFILSFLLGLIIDIFSDTPGVNALACTLVAAIRKPIYYSYMAKDDMTSRLIPGVFTMGMMEYSKFLFTFVLIFCLLVFSIEYFSFINVKGIVIFAGSSAIFTFILLLATDCLIPTKS